MTVYESLKYWLNEILTGDDFLSDSTVIDLETVPEFEQCQNAALFSSPNDMQAQMIGGQTRHTVFKTFYIRRDFDRYEKRLANEAYFEKLKKRINDRNLDCVMPKDGRKWRSINYNGGVYPSQRADDNKYAIYQVNLRLEYIE